METLQNRLARTNFVANVRNTALDRATYRGPGSVTVPLMANGYYVCHLSEFPGLTYKKAHTATNSRTRAGLNSEVAYLFLSDEGYDLQWPPGVQPGPDVPFERIDYHAWSLITPGNGFHQHFNLGNDTIRYVVLRRGNPELTGRTREDNPQIEFKDEDPKVWTLFEEEIRKRGYDPSGMADYKMKEPE